MKIILKDGSFKEYENSKSVIEIAADISEGLARVATAGEIDGEVVDLRTVVDKDCELNILTFNDEKGKGSVPSHSLSYHGTGCEEIISGDKTGDRTICCRRILL
jgi:threonyl-tRNA synthetase (EC 6.1.1.3)/Ser-tRNA(Thr) hydrolase (EC 3.1.1.-)